MRNVRGSANQLSLTDIFDKQVRRQKRLVDDIFEMIKLVKMYRTHTSFSSIQMSAEAHDCWNEILYNLAVLAKTKSRAVIEYRSQNLEWFLEKTRDGVYLSMTTTPSDEQIRTYITNWQKRFEIFVKRYAPDLIREEDLVNRITDYTYSLYAIQSNQRKEPF